MEFQTLRPLGGLVGNVVSDEDRIVERMLDVIESSLDDGAGWTVRRPDGLTWFPSRLALEVNEFAGSDDPGLRSDVVVVRNVTSVSPELLSRLNDLNAHAAGWVYWFDPDDGVITSTASCPMVQQHWWWCWVLLILQQNQVAVAESVADELAELAGGEVAVSAHPDRGVRTEVDEWIAGARLGAREPCASLDMFLTSLDYQKLNDALGVLAEGLEIETWCPLRVELADGDGRVLTQMGRHWHPEHGWGLQIATAAHGPNDAAGVDDPESLVTLAAEWNTDMVRQGGRLILGGWVAVDGLGLMNHVFAPAFAVEHIANDSQDSFGAVLGLVMAHLAEAALATVPPEPPTSEVDDANERLRSAASGLHRIVGPLGWSYLQDREHQPAGVVGDPDGPEDEADASWLIPRHIPICSFGIFNPIGPTVSSLEVAETGSEWVLLFVLRNPFGPVIEDWGRTAPGDVDHLDQLISDALAVTEGGPMGPGPDWMDIFNRDAAVLDGITRFARGSDLEMLTGRANELLHYYADPWARLTQQDGPLESPDRGAMNPVDLWTMAITDREVVAGHQLFIRSAWLGAKAMVEGGPDDAWSISNALISSARGRVLGDYSFRGEEGLLVQHPLTR